MARHRYFLFISFSLHLLFFYFLHLLELLQFRLKFPISPLFPLLLQYKHAILNAAPLKKPVWERLL